MTSRTITEQISEILIALSSPVSQEEKASGWAVESKSAAYKYFSGLQASLNTGGSLPPLGIVRGLDHWGVIGGELLESIAQVTNYLRTANGRE